MKKLAKTIKTKKEKKMTIEDLALMVARSFESLPTREEMNTRFDEAAKENKDRFDRIENILIRALDNRTLKLEDEVRVLKTTVERILKKV
jgi:hypothetical protein